MQWLADPDAWSGRVVFERGLALVYVVAFASTIAQFRALLSSTGLLPVPAYLAVAPWRRTPSVFHLFYRDWFFLLVCWVGLAVSVLTLVGVSAALPVWAYPFAWLVPWAAYLSVVHVGQRWYSFGWEMLICEAGFLAAFLGPADVAPAWPVGVAVAWLLFRLELGAGLIKLRGDRCWRDLTCLYYHHETQPMPGPLSRWFHLLPKPLHRAEVAANHVVQLVVPFGLFLPQPVAGVAAGLVIVTQLWLVLSGNFAWLNVLTIVLATYLVDWGGLLGLAPPSVQPIPTLWTITVLGLAAVVLGTAWPPARNLVAPAGRQRMNASWNPLYIGNAYGAFGSVGKVRREVVIEGTDVRRPNDSTVWKEYGFRGKPGDVRRRPRQVAPYHLRLDWLLWFAALSPVYGKVWFDRLLVALLRADRPVLRLLRSDPFGGEPPVWVRAVTYRYRFTTHAEHRATGAVWVRDQRQTYAAARRLKEEVRR